MDSVVGTIFAGIVIVVIGILNTMGKIESLHRYHRKRVTEEKRIPFGRLVGSGTIVIGAAVTMSGFLSLAAKLLNNTLFDLIGNILIAVGAVIGLGIGFYAMFKYNKGIF